MASTPENKVKAALKKQLVELGVWFAGRPKPQEVTGWMYMPVPNGMGVNGIPDFAGIYKGRPLYIEAKADKGLLSENQKQRAIEIIAAGGAWIVARNVDDLMEGLREQHL